MVIRVLYFASGDLAYGGKLHGLMAGSIFAGRISAVGLELRDCSVLLPGSGRRDARLSGEAYYIDAWRLSELDSRLEGFGARRATVRVEHGDVVLNAETHLAEDCRPATDTAAGRGWVRLLLVLPPRAPPPVQPMAVYLADIAGVSLCSSASRLLCRGGSIENAAMADVYVELGRLADWLEELGGEPVQVTGRMKPLDLTVFAVAPVAKKV
ncbi:hypothetical protein [Hyperthermus butylicus]|uniref:Uncharacterized protein n=1 Tax=Hyperthermus butylicus (strain DSM 5456 / JCM 9403 / PLM1-5) TaxID=415426 RepID=A2BKS1_HYPBU|nr:hypothetical protein [Hyperthermus butylicus]ABM80582.1 hypothetical protein Hbut_0728 [Hyperthermus butylicus DSM 5456]